MFVAKNIWPTACLPLRTCRKVNLLNVFRMGDEDTRRGDGGDVAPGIQFLNTFVVMEDVLDKLKLLDYESVFCSEWGFKPFARLDICQCRRRIHLRYFI